jgi:hypothetical protein
MLMRQLGFWIDLSIEQQKGAKKLSLVPLVLLFNWHLKGK